MALCGDERNEWFYKLPMSLLAIRTTLKPDINASPADLVYGEGLAVPGDLLPNQPNNNDDLDQERRRMLANLRLEVSRLQPTQTSSHRQPLVHVPDDLANATHVFVRRGGVNPPLTLPYEGPYPVHSRTATGIKVDLPGRGVEEVALARIRPAFTENDPPQQPQQQPQQPRQPPAPPPPPPPPPPPSPPPPRPPTRLLDPTRRNTRQNPRTAPSQPTTSAPVPSTSRRLDPDVFDDETLDNRLQDLRRADRPANSDSQQTQSDVPDPFDGHCPTDPNLTACQCERAHDPAAPCNAGPAPTPAPAPAPTPSRPRFFTTNSERKFSKTNESETRPKGPSNPVASNSKTHSFSNPKPGDFSYRRRRPDVSALREILQSLN